jgi:cytidylate kinase
LTRRRGGNYRRQVPRNVICISREFGAGGEEVGVLAARELGFRCLDGEILARAAEKGALDAGTVADAEQRRSIARRLLDAIGNSAAIAPEAYAHMPPQEIVIGARQDTVRSLIRQAIDDFADDGYAVIVAHAASHALAGRAGVLRVLVTGSPSTRAARIRGDAATEEESLRQITESDRARAAYLSEFYGVKDEQAIHYDLVVSTDVLTPQEAAEIVVRAAQV